MSKIPLALLGLLAGCTQVDDPELSEVEQLAKKKPGDCETYGCGQNSPEVEGRLFWSLHELGQYNDQNIRLEKYEKKIGTNWVTLRPDVVKGELRGMSGSTVVVAGTGVKDTRFTLWDATDQIRYYVTVASAARSNMWAVPSPGGSTQAWSYELTYWSDINLQRRNLCTAAGTPSNNPYEPMNPFHAVLFDDDRISPDDIAVYAEEKDWFTIGCAGSALAKLHLSGYTAASSKTLATPTTLEQRTGYLKMITGDYCGNGNAWTFAGVPLHYRDKPGKISTVAPGEKIEAVWSHKGALCLNTPRIDAHASAFPLFGSSIVDELTNPNEPWACALPPPCTPALYSPGYNYGGGTVLSTNY